VCVSLHLFFFPISDDTCPLQSCYVGIADETASSSSVSEESLPLTSLRSSVNIEPPLPSMSEQSSAANTDGTISKKLV
jgi:hypothetical protein